MALTEKDFLKSYFGIVGNAGYASTSDILAYYITKVQSKMMEDELPLDFVMDEIEFGSFLNKTSLPCAVLYNPDHPEYMRACMYVILNGSKYTIRGAQLSYTARVKGYPTQKKGLSLGKALLSNNLDTMIGAVEGAVSNFFGGSEIEKQNRRVWELYFSEYFENINKLD